MDNDWRKCPKLDPGMEHSDEKVNRNWKGVGHLGHKM